MKTLNKPHHSTMPNAVSAASGQAVVVDGSFIMEGKMCNVCKEFKLLSEFHKNRCTKSGLCVECKVCKNKYASEYQQKNKDKHNANNRKYRKTDKAKLRTKRVSKIWRLANPEKVIKMRKTAYEKNKIKLNKHNVAYKKNRKKTDKLYKLKDNLRCRISLFLRLSGYKKKSKTEYILGASFEIVKLHLERQFTKGMKWSNHGRLYGKWNIDHKIPLSSAKTEEEAIALCHYTNLQPLWFEDNNKKGCKILPIQTTLTI